VRRGETMLAIGLVCVAGGAAFTQLVLIGLVGLALIAVAFALLLCAGLVFEVDRPVPPWRQVTGFTIYFAGAFLLMACALHATSLAHGEALHLQRGLAPVARLHWPWLLACSFASAAALGVGLVLRSAMPWGRALSWGLVAWSVLPAAVYLFRLLARSLPITA